MIKRIALLDEIVRRFMRAIDGIDIGDGDPTNFRHLPTTQMLRSGRANAGGKAGLGHFDKRLLLRSLKALVRQRDRAVT